MKTTQIIEALLFASDAPLSAADLARGEEELDEAGVQAAIETLRAQYEDHGRAFQVYEIAGGYQLLTRPEFAPYLERFDTVPQPAPKIRTVFNRIAPLRCKHADSDLHGLDQD
mgnify:CR=1 FL=1